MGVSTVIQANRDVKIYIRQQMLKLEWKVFTFRKGYKWRQKLQKIVRSA